MHLQRSIFCCYVSFSRVYVVPKSIKGLPAWLSEYSICCFVVRREQHASIEHHQLKYLHPKPLSIFFGIWQPHTSTTSQTPQIQMWPPLSHPNQTTRSNCMILALSSTSWAPRQPERCHKGNKLRHLWWRTLSMFVLDFKPQKLVLVPFVAKQWSKTSTKH